MVKEIPAEVYMGRDGIIRYIHTGDMTEEELRKVEKERKELVKESRSRKEEFWWICARPAGHPSRQEKPVLSY
jgi:hypothetical protein